MQAFVVPTATSRTIDGLAWQERPVPMPGAGEVLIRTHAVGLNPVDYKVVEEGVAAWTFPHTLGLDVAGVVQQVGPGVTVFQPGQRVCGHGNLVSERGLCGERGCHGRRTGAHSDGREL
jgi:NADPH:quinone reductase and related Zn-dependent oxidoreductases